MKLIILYMLMIISPLSVFAQITDSLTAYYPFTGNTGDASGNNNNGVPSGATLAEDRNGNTDRAYSFDGQDDYIVVLDNPNADIPDDFSLCLWVKPTTTPTMNTVFLSKNLEFDTYDGSWWLGLTPDMKMIFEGTPYFSYNGVLSNLTIPLNQWTHLALAFSDSSDRWTVYINGELDTTSILPLELEDNDNDLYIGTRINANALPGYHFQGSMDEIRIYHRTLSEADASNLFNAAPQLALSSNQIDFGNVRINTIQPDFCTVKNTGSDELRVDSLRITGTDFRSFNVDSSGFNITTGDSHLVTVNFAPERIGAFNATLELYSNAGDTTIGLHGFGRAPQIETGVDSLNYGMVIVGNDTIRSLDITNTGNDTLIINQAELFGTDYNEFFLINGNPVPVIAPGDTHTMEIRFAPQSVGAKTMNLFFFSNSPGSPDSVVLLGRGINVAVVNVEPDTTPVAGDSLRLTINAPQGFRPTTYVLYYRQPGETTWRSVQLDTSGGDFNGVIPPDSVTYKGLEYYVFLSDGQNDISFPPDNPQTQPARLQVSVDKVTTEARLRAATYRMISVPVLLDNADIFEALRDDYGIYNEQWRLLRWSEQDSAYLDLESPNFTADLTPGTAFWLITRTGEPFDVENCWSMDLSQSVFYLLTPGWNMVSNPFPFPIASDSVRGTDELPYPVHYNGSNYQYDITVMYPWEGYFAYNPLTTPATIEIPPIPAPEGLYKAKDIVSINTEDEYYIQIAAEMSNTLLVDPDNYIGLKHDAKPGLDNSDIFEAPPIGDYVQLSIVENKTRYAANFKSVTGEGQQWKLTVNATIPRRKIKFNVTEYGQLPDGFKLHILDEDFECPVQLTNGSFAISLKDSASQRHFKIIIGTDSYAEQHNDEISLTPISYTLSQNYPNPFNPETTIEYQIARRAEVKLEIFNMLGQKIRTLVHEVQRPGQHKIIWDGINDTGQQVASGIYIFSLESGNFTATRKLVLIR